MNVPAPLLRIAWLLAVWKVNARIKRAFTAKSEEAVPAHRTNTNIWTVVTHSTIPTDGSCPIAVTEERSQAQVPVESKNRFSSINQALPSSDHCFLMCGGPEPRGTWGLIPQLRDFFWPSKEIYPPGRHGRALTGNRGRQGSTGGPAFQMLFSILIGQHCYLI